ncbi:Chitin synthase, class 7 [Malassezia brasiliensis]|uniref:Chitin synthase export chaperone n=1 Tax=Malassezia brasiliensis TaxID=1821822 RepID=A0AAF0DQG5_9BASI|nr:Chitin synthase, class 7 [Malassezia brasiliensis]
MTAIMVYHVHCKYTAVGRKEIVFFFYLYGVSELLVLFLDSAVIPTHTGAYRWFTAIYIGLKTCIFWCLMLNGFVGFQFAEDGTPLSLWTLRLSTLVFWVVGFAVSAWTFGDVKNAQGGLWFFEFIFPIIMVAIYIVSQVVLVVRTLDDFWAINDIALGTIAYVAGIILMFGFNNQICESVKHYIDGTFFITLCMLFSVMMVYKFWDDITKEDLEFSVGSKHSAWDTKEPLVSSDFDGSMLSHDFGRTILRNPRLRHLQPPPPNKVRSTFAIQQRDAGVGRLESIAESHVPDFASPHHASATFEVDSALKGQFSMSLKDAQQFLRARRSTIDSVDGVAQTMYTMSLSDPVNHIPPAPATFIEQLIETAEREISAWLQQTSPPVTDFEYTSTEEFTGSERGDTVSDVDW